jgi:hypothetical protein
MESIKLIAGIRLSDVEELLVASGILPERLEGYTSGDQLVGPVIDFLRSKKLPWSETFVSVFIFLPDDDTTWVHEAFGYPFELNIDEILPSLVLVCSDDIQNCASNKRLPKCCANLTGMNDRDKIAVLIKARRVSESKRVEGRIHRPLRLSDVIPLTPAR